MNRSARLGTTVGASAVLGCLAVGLAAGTISTEGAVLSTGEAPSRGRVILDGDGPASLAPDVAPPEAPPAGGYDLPSTRNTDVGRLSPLPPLSGGEDLVISGDSELPGGIYDLDSFTVKPGVGVRFKEAVTLRIAGDALVEGRVETTGLASSIDIQCGGDFVLRASTSSATGREAQVTAQAWNSRVRIEAGGDLSISAADGHKAYVFGGLGAFLLSHGADTSVRIQGADLFGGPSWGIYIGTEGGVSLRDSWIGQTGLYLFARGGDAVVRGTTFVGATELSASGAVDLGSGTVFDATYTRLLAGGRVEIHDGALVDAASGETEILAGDGVEVASGGRVRNFGRSSISVVAYGGDVVLGGTDGPAAGIEHRAFGDAVVRAAGSVRILGTGFASTVDGAIRLDAAGGDLSFADGATASSRNGAIDLRASGVVEDEAAGGTAATISGGTVRISAGVVRLAAAVVEARTGDCVAAASGAVRFGGTMTAAGSLSLASVGASVDLTGADLATQDGGAASGSVSVQSFAGDEGAVDAGNAVVRTGDAGEASGDILLRVQPALVPDPPAGGGDDGADDGEGDEGDGGDEDLDPDSARLLVSSHDSSLKVAGKLTADPAVDAGDEIRVSVAGVTRTLRVDRVSRDGAVLARGENGTLQLKPARGRRPGSFRIRWQGDLGGVVDRDGTGEVRLRVRSTRLDARGRARMERGRLAR